MKTEETFDELPNESDPNVTVDEQKYPALRTVATIFSILGWLVIGAGGLCLYYFISSGETLYGVLAVIGGLILSLPFFAYSNLIYVLIDIEYNTRKTAQALNKP